MLKRLVLIAVLTGLMSSGTAAQQNPLTIWSVNTDATTLFISGVNFNPGPTVFLSGMPLNFVVNAAGTQIMAALPSVPAGTYLLHVTRGNAPHMNATFSVAIGAIGPAGAIGPSGPPGPKGATGDTGAEGPTGAAGPTGATGATGAQGPIGPVGPVGAIGAQGPIGATGAIGPMGPMGPAGAVGPIGPMGPIGGSWYGRLSPTALNRGRLGTSAPT